MTTHPSLHIQSNRGAAIVIVLALIVLMLGLAIAFLSRVQNDRVTSSIYAAAATSRQLADTTVGLVQTQINKATTQGSDVAWASQPGMIRTFSNSGGLLQAFKLYSADNMILDAPNKSALDTEFAIAASWQSDKAIWTDLNAPVIVRVNGADVQKYPILDPGADGRVEGFQIAAPPGNNSAKGQMPVKWLYLLQNGTLVAPGGNGNTATVTGATKNNPIVGRIAFWTDDETCKVNVNTASEGSFWDTPRLDTAEERDLAKNQPAQKEFQRYPGHPATTSLAPIFFANSATSTPDLTQAQREAIYSLIPRVNGGGSLGGSTVATAAITPDSDRLYASVDELVFAADRSAQAVDAGATRDKIEQARFFLTTHSRAPELTLFNTPRVSMWPLDSNATNNYRTAFDRLIAFCTTINGQPYYFARSNPKSATDDYDTIARNQQIYAYLKNLTSLNIPGFGGKFDTKLGSDRDQVLTEIFDYIRSTNLDDSGLPIANRYGERGELSPNNAALLSAGANQVTPIRIGSTQGFGRFPTITEVGIQFICTAKADDLATTAVDESLGSNTTMNRTLGSTLLTTNQRRVEALFFFETFIPSLANPKIYDAYCVRITGLNGFQLNGQPLGFPADGTDLSHRNRGFCFHGRDYGGTFSPRGTLSGRPGETGSMSRLPARGVMPADAGITALTLYPFVSAPVTIDAAAGTMTFIGGTITVEIYPRSQSSAPGYSTGTQPVQTLTMTFPGGTFPIPDLVDAGTPAYDASYNIATDKENWWSFSLDGAIAGKPGRLQGWSRIPSGNTTNNTLYIGDIFHPKDVVRSMVPSQNDYRLLALNLPANAGPTTFVKHPSYDTVSASLAHAVSENYLTDVIRGRSVQSTGYPGTGSGVSYDSSSLPDVPLPSTESASGDWDNGMATLPDGPYINRPDEGNIFNIALEIPYFDNTEQSTTADSTFFSPNRLIPSAGMLGSLPSQPKAGKAFQTLLFRAQAGHPGNTSPPDHLITDLFWMPVVEPYAISEPLSTAGKINMNYEIAPFGEFITRSTGVVSLLRSEKLLAIPKSAGPSYKVGATPASRINSFRTRIDAHETLTQFKDVFDTGDIFRSASQIMALHLVPKGENLSGMTTFWTEHSLTGDNSREKPYADLLGRLTTKSNTFTVHYRVQTLKKVQGTDSAVWDENRDQVVSEHRGSTAIERFINPNESTIIDYATASYPLTSGQDLGAKYKWRILSVSTFAP